MQVYAFQAYLEGQVAAALLPSQLSNPGSWQGAAGSTSALQETSLKPLERNLAQLRLAQAFLGKGLENGLCSVVMVDSEGGCIIDSATARQQ